MDIDDIIPLRNLSSQLPAFDDGSGIEGSVVDNPTEASNHRSHGIWLFIQIAIPFLLAGFGLCFAGLIFDFAGRSEPFVKVGSLTKMVTTILGLKGNLEMTLASRLSTSASTGEFITSDLKHVVIAGNLMLVQVQSIGISLMACPMVLAFEKFSSISQIIFVFVACTSAACIAGAVISALISGIVLASTRIPFDPDNIAIPIAATLGDIVTISCLLGTSKFFYAAMNNFSGFSVVCLLVIIAIFGIFIFLTNKNVFVRDTLKTGWYPLIASMVISLVAGWILGESTLTYPALAIFQPLINGTGGNLVSVQVSRYGTALHKLAKRLRDARERVIQQSAITQENAEENERIQHANMMLHARSTSGIVLNEVGISKILLSVVVPGQIVFVAVLYVFKRHSYSFDPLLVFLYVAGCLIQSSALLGMARFLTPIVWNVQANPDNVCIPILTATGDLLGTVILAMIFAFLHANGHNTGLKNTSISNIEALVNQPLVN